VPGARGKTQYSVLPVPVLKCFYFSSCGCHISSGLTDERREFGYAVMQSAICM
jgi:hypothetical protein